MPTTPRPPARSTVIMVTWRGRQRLAAVLDALASQTRPHLLLVVDNASDDGSAEVLATHPAHPRVIRTERNLGFAGALELTLPQVTTEFVAWLNDDVVARPGWLAALEDALDTDPAAAAAASRLLGPDSAPLSTGGRLTITGYGADLAEMPDGEEVFGFCGGAALVRTDALLAVGGLPRGFFCYYEDTDVSWRLRLAGHRIITTADAVAVHYHGASAQHGSPDFHHWNERNRLLMLLRCAPLVVATRELARFALITGALMLRRPAPDAPNFDVGLRVRVLAQVTARLPTHLRQRSHIGRRSVLSRRAVWNAWAGRDLHPASARSVPVHGSGGW